MVLRSHRCYCILCAALGMALAWLLFFASTPAAHTAPPKGKVSFIRDVAPILKENCLACHDARKRKGKLDMTTFENLRKGGRSEIDPIVPGKPDESYLLELMTATDVSRMPPKDSGDAVPKDKIEIVKKWIAEGAKLDEEIKPKSNLLRELRARWKPPVPPAQYQYPVIITAVTFSPDDKKIIAGGHHEITQWDLETGKLEKRLRTRAERTYAIAFLPDGKLVAAGGRPGQEGEVKIYDLNANGTKENGIVILDGVNDNKVMIHQLLESDDVVLCLDLSADGKRLVSGGSDRLVHVWDLSKGVSAVKLDQTIENHADWVFSVELALDNKHLVTCSRDKTAKVWDLSAKESVMTFPGHQEPVFGVTVRPDSKMGFSVGQDKQIRSWNMVGNRRQVRAGGGHGDIVFKVIHHPKQAMVATCSADKTVRLWETGRLRATKTLSGHTDWVYAINFSKDGSKLVSGAYNGEIRVWNVADGKVIKAFNGSPGWAATSKTSK